MDSQLGIKILEARKARLIRKKNTSTQEEIQTFEKHKGTLQQWK
jgi:hypothetical protein